MNYLLSKINFDFNEITDYCKLTSDILFLKRHIKYYNETEDLYSINRIEEMIYTKEKIQRDIDLLIKDQKGIMCPIKGLYTIENCSKIYSLFHKTQDIYEKKLCNIYLFMYTIHSLKSEDLVKSFKKTT